MAGTPYITVETVGGRKVVREHASKAAAHKHGMARRRAGATIFAHSVEAARKLGLDPRVKKGKASAFSRTAAGSASGG